MRADTVGTVSFIQGNTYYSFLTRCWGETFLYVAVLSFREEVQGRAEGEGVGLEVGHARLRHAGG